jgi:hypothetical protein
MKNKMQFRKVPAFSVLTTFLWFGFATLACAQSAPAPAQNPVQDNDGKRPSEDRDNSLQRPEVARFNEFLDSHREIAEQLKKNPSLANSQEFLQSHPALRTYLQDHPEISQQLKDNPGAFMREEDRFGRDADRADRNDRDTNRREVANFSRFLDSHRETAERLRRDPSLVDNQQFLKDHTALQSYLQDHPAVRQEIKENPDAFMQQEARYEHHDRDEDMNRDWRGGRDISSGHFASFGQFLGTHSNIAEQISKDPSLVKNQEYLQNHPELQDYLNSHPDVRHDLMADPQGFVKSAQQFNANSQAIKTPVTPSAETKPIKQ